MEQRGWIEGNRGRSEGEENTGLNGIRPAAMGVALEGGTSSNAR